jgi:hypothetical protein
MVAQIDEQQSAMITNAMAPARQTHRFADVALPKLAAGVSAVAVHPRNPMNVVR